MDIKVVTDFVLWIEQIMRLNSLWQNLLYGTMIIMIIDVYLLIKTIYKCVQN